MSGQESNAKLAAAQMMIAAQEQELTTVKDLLGKVQAELAETRRERDWLHAESNLRGKDVVTLKALLGEAFDLLVDIGADGGWRSLTPGQQARRRGITDRISRVKGMENA